MGSEVGLDLLDSVEWSFDKPQPDWAYVEVKAVLNLTPIQKLDYYGYMGIIPIESKHLLNLHINYEENMSRTARRLHDEVTIAISQVKLKLNMICSDLAGEDHTHKKEFLAINQHLDQILNKSRHLTEALRPPILDDLGLGDALNWQARTYSEESNIKVHVEHTFAENDLQEPLKTGTFRLLQDLLNHLALIAEANSVRITFEIKESTLHIRYQDNGINMSAAMAEEQDLKEMILIQARAMGMGGELSVIAPSHEGNDFCIILPIKPQTIDKEGKS